MHAVRSVRATMIFAFALSVVTLATAVVLVAWICFGPEKRGELE